MQKAVFAFTCNNCGKKWRDSKPANHEMDECPFCGSTGIDSEKVGSMGCYAVDECPTIDLKPPAKEKKEKQSKSDRKKKREELREKKREVSKEKQNQRRS